MIINLLNINKLFRGGMAEETPAGCRTYSGHILPLFWPKNVREKIMLSVVMNGKGRSA
jgi:hypothetical protein